MADRGPYARCSVCPQNGCYTCPEREAKPGRVGVALTFFGPGCWMWQTDDGQEGVAGTREQALEDARAAVRPFGNVLPSQTPKEGS